MEQYIKNFDISGVTYLSELTPPPLSIWHRLNTKVVGG